MNENDIAIIGMAVRAPGARSLNEFWDNLVAGRESIESLSEEALLAAGEPVSRLHNSHYVPRAAILPGMEMFDAEFFGVSPKEAAIMDPQHRHFLECSWEAFENAARMPDGFDGPVGVFAGCGMGSYFYFNVCSNRQLVDQVGMFLLRHTGNDKDFLSTRVSYLFDLKGPSVTVQTACSTSLVAVHYACQSLLSRECDMALAGGVTIEFPHRRGYVYQDGEILSPDGHCRPFDQRAAGTVFGSGVGTVVLRRLEDALRDGDPIHAVIKATAVNNDGASKAGYLAPSVTGQAAAIIEAQALAGIGADEVGYVECHGTGTYLGDPIEVEALTQAFRRSASGRGFCRIGSVKSNIGHTDTAAGVIGLIKAAMTVKHGRIPATLNFERPNPTINFAESPFVVNDKLHEWSTPNGVRIAAVNSLGVGGTNAHAILQSPPQVARAAAGANDDEKPTLLVVSARSKNALDDAARRLANALEADPSLALRDAAHTLIAGRKQFEHRKVIPVASRRDAIEICREPASRRTSIRRPLEGEAEAVFVFPGGGAQYVRMAAALYRTNPQFRASVEEGLSYLAPGAGEEVRRAWLGADSHKGALLHKPSVQLPAILILEVAMARLWMDWGIKPAALIGHSMGENAAACIAGVFSFRDAVNLVRVRGTLFEEIAGGGMLSVALSEDTLKGHLFPELDIASVNAPDLCVVSGTKADLQRFADHLLGIGIESQAVAIDVAAHSRMLEPILGRFEALLRSIPLRTPTIPIVSNLTSEILTADQARDPMYWVRHLRSTVRFAAGIKRIADARRVFVEVGPGKTLSSLVKAQGIDANQVINSLPHADDTTDDGVHVLGALGAAWALGLPLDVAKLWSDGTPRRVALPTYPFRRQHYFIEQAAPASQDLPHELPQRHKDVADWGYEVAWRQAVPPVRAGATPDRKRWLVLLDDAGLGAELCSRLTQAGHEVVTVAIGDGFRRLGAQSYVLCPEDGRGGFDELLAHLTADKLVPDRIVDLWLYTFDEAHRPGSSFFHRNQERGFYTLFYLARALGQTRLKQDIALTVLTNGMQRVGAEPIAYPDKSTVLGAVQVLPKEYPNLSIRAIDLPFERDGRAFAPAAPRQLDIAALVKRLAIGAQAAPVWLDLLWDDLHGDSGNEIVAYRDGRRWVSGFTAVQLPAAASDATGFKPGGAYLITGGLGDLALLFAQGLATHVQARLVLVGRTALPPHEEWERVEANGLRTDRVAVAIRAIRAIEQAGGTVLYCRADVTNVDEMKAALAEAEAAFGRLDGVLHTAGVVKDELVELKTEADLEVVLAPKVYGTEVLIEVLGERKLDIVVLFSSTSTAIAPAGQIDYVAANAYLNAVAQSRAMQAHGRVLALQWGIWNEIGLAARAGGAERDVADVREVAQPLITLRKSEPDGRLRFELTCGPQSHWILNEHRLGTSEAVWPGTGYIELLLETARELGFSQTIGVEQLSFVNPLNVPDNGARTITLSVTAKSGGRRQVTIESMSADMSTQVHAEATLSGSAAAGGTIDVTAIVARCTGVMRAGAGQTLCSAQEGFLNFGERWSVLKATHRGSGEMLAELELDTRFAGDLAEGYLAHPALLDIATGYAMALIDGYDPAQSLWVPAGYGRLRVFAPLPRQIVSWVRIQPSQDLGADYATFGVTVAAPDGTILLEAEEFTIRRVGSSFAADDADGRASHRSELATARLRQAQAALSPAQQQLAQLVAQGIRPAEGFEAFLRATAAKPAQLVVSSMDLFDLMRPPRMAAQAQASEGGFERPESDIDYVEPRPGIEATLATFWRELLGVKTIGANDNFFDLGGHSLIAVRLFRMIKAEFAVDFPMSVLFEAPTIAQCAALLAEAGAGGGADPAAPAADAAAKPPARRYTHLVPMSAGPAIGARPFFICAGMFGNILNLRHLAMHLGEDRPVYGLQAKGLFGNESPHTSFEEMARGCIAELRTVQPNGPYHLGGFSGGGLVAYEMAQQLERDGETVSLVVLLDTPVPQRVDLSLRDRLVMKWQDARRQKGAFISEWLRSRLAWELARWRKRSGADQDAEDGFNNGAIEAAFLKALWAYQLLSTRAKCLLLRPKLHVSYRLPGGRDLNDVRNLVSADNGWEPYAEDLTITEVPGNHDSMVLEPHVRVLARRIRDLLREAERSAAPLARAAE